MITEPARRLAERDEITREKLEAILIYLLRKLSHDKEADRAISLITVKSERMIEESLRIRANILKNMHQDVG